MGKVKNKGKKKGLSDNLVKSDTQKKKKPNPFEVHVNRQKYAVLGRRSKNDTGLPGVARAKAINKRKKTLLQEFKLKDKANKFLDRRIGEKNSAMTAEDRIMARFTAERMKMHNKKSIFNLADDEILTHHGQTLSEIEKFDDPRSDDEDEEERGKLGAEFVEDAHFGGGVLSKSGEENQSSRKNVIEQLIAESKKRKAEKQRAREQTIELTEKLDTEWKDLLPIVSASKVSANSVLETDKPDSYDTVMRQLKFEARGKPSERLKSEEELAREEKERLETLENERLKRMQGLKEDTVAERKHRSADDLDDGFAMESEEEITMTYDDEGKLDARLEANSNPESEVDSMKEDKKENASEESEKSSDTEENDYCEDDGMDDLSDLKKVPESEEDTSEHEDSANESKSTKKKHSANESKITEEKYSANESKSTRKKLCTETISDKEKLKNEIKVDLLARKEIMELARKELPYTFQVPDTYEDLQALLSTQSPDHQTVILERMIKCNHPSLGQGLKSKLADLFGFLLQHLQDVAVSTKNGEEYNCFIVLDRIIQHLYDLTQIAPENSGHCIIEVLKEKQLDFRERSRSFPGLDTLVFLKLITYLFPTSDFWHPVVTPALVFINQLLSQCRVKNVQGVSTGLFLVTLILEYTLLSKRFCPAAINFLDGVIGMAVPKKTIRLVSIVHPVHISSRARNLLVLTEPLTLSDSKPLRMNLSDLQSSSHEDDSFKFRSLYTAVKLTLDFFSNLTNLSACYEIFKPISNTLKELIGLEKYPNFFQEDIRNLIARIEERGKQKRQFLILEKKKPKALRLYEPRIEEVFDRKQRRPMGKERQEHEKLLHKYKREMKGAIREIRRDKSFLAKLKLKQTLRNDTERKQKVKEIFGSAALQQGELRKLKRKK